MNKMIESVVLEAVRRQPWFKRYSNTVVAGIGAVAAILSFVATLSLPIPEQWAGAIPAAISFLTALGIKLTVNGIAPSAARKLSPVVDEQEEPVRPASSVPDVTPSVSGLPVWDQPSSIPDEGYTGRHRLDG